jgi:hypothetical protein
MFQPKYGHGGERSKRKDAEPMRSRMAASLRSVRWPVDELLKQGVARFRVATLAVPHLGNATSGRPPVPAFDDGLVSPSARGTGTPIRI